MVITPYFQIVPVAEREACFQCFMFGFIYLQHFQNVVDLISRTLFRTHYQHFPTLRHRHGVHGKYIV